MSEEGVKAILLEMSKHLLNNQPYKLSFEYLALYLLSQFEEFKYLQMKADLRYEEFRNLCSVRGGSAQTGREMFIQIVNVFESLFVGTKFESLVGTIKLLKDETNFKSADAAELRLKFRYNTTEEIELLLSHLGDVPDDINEYKGLIFSDEAVALGMATLEQERATRVVIEPIVVHTAPDKQEFVRDDRQGQYIPSQTTPLQQSVLPFGTDRSKKFMDKYKDIKQKHYEFFENERDMRIADFVKQSRERDSRIIRPQTVLSGVQPGNVFINTRMQVEETQGLRNLSTKEESVPWVGTTYGPSLMGTTLKMPTPTTTTEALALDKYILESVQGFYQVVQTYIQSLRPYPFYELDAPTSLKYLAYLSTTVFPNNPDAKSLTLQPTEITSKGLDLLKINSAEFLNWIDTFRSIFPDAIKAVDGRIIDTDALAINSAYSKLSLVPKTEVTKDLIALQTSSQLAEHLRQVASLNAASDLVTIKTKINMYLEALANNKTVLNFLRNKTVQSLNGERHIVALKLSQDKLEKVYQVMNDHLDFENDPRLFDLKKQRSELYEMKKMITAGKYKEQMAANIPASTTDAVYEIRIENVIDFHSLYINFPGYDSSRKITDKEIGIFLKPTWLNEDGNSTITNEIKLYSFKRYNETTGITIKPKAYGYWIKTMSEVYFKSRFPNAMQVFVSGTAEALPDQDKLRSQVDYDASSEPVRISLIIKVKGYNDNKPVAMGLSVYRLSKEIKYEFLKGTSKGAKFVHLLSLISNKNYKVDKYREKVANRIKYGYMNQNKKMIDKVYRSMGGKIEKKRY